jgi:hypothetical protein
MEKLNADVMIGPLSGDEAVYIANYAKARRRRRSSSARPVSGSDDADRSEEHVPLPATAPSGTRASEDRLQEAQLAEGRDHDGRLQLRLDVEAQA